MARPGSQMIAGYYPTPANLLPNLASLLRFQGLGSSKRPILFDPCAGDGDAIASLGRLWFEESYQLFACEMESGRFAALQERFTFRQDRLFHGDAFGLQRTDSGSFGATVCYLNPPYDQDPDFGRLEHRFLERFTSFLAPGHGWLFYVVPGATLLASAAYLATHYEKVQAFRFPDPEFSRFGQVVLLCRRRECPQESPEPFLEEEIRGWGSSPESLPPLVENPEPVEVEMNYYSPFGLDVEHLPFDAAEALPSVRLFEPCGFADLSAEELQKPIYTTASPPRPAHIALALSAGIFNGQRLEPNEPGFPPLLVKGIFRRDLLTLKENRDEEGALSSRVEMERPRLQLTVLRLDTYTFHELNAGTVPTRNQDVSEWNVADLLLRYDRALAAELQERFQPLHDPSKPHHQMALPRLARVPYPIQAQAIQTALKLLASGRNPFLVAEVGTGKTTMALSIAAALSPQHHGATLAELRRTLGQLPELRPVTRTLVVCPPHLLDTWQEEAAAVLPGARVVALQQVSDLHQEADIYLLSRERAKLGHKWEGVREACPGCGAPLSTGSPTSRASRRARCKASLQRPANDAARVLLRLVKALFPFYRGKKALSAFPVSSTLRKWADRQNYGPSDLASLSLEILASHCEELASLHSSNWQIGCAGRDLKSAAGRAPESRWEGLNDALKSLSGSAEWFDDGTCNEPLFSAVPKPRRLPLAQVIQRWFRDRFDLLILDEAHEYNHSGSAQTRAAHRLINLPGVPSVVLTGSLMGGYASSLFPNFWALSPLFRQEFSRKEQGRFVSRYGFRKFLTEPAKKSQTRSLGILTDREMTPVRVLGEAPGILPTFLLRHLLPTAVTVHKSDLEESLPPLCEEPVPLPIDPQDDQALALLREGKRLERILLDRIKEDLFNPERHGRLLGALAELPSYLDRATDDQPPFEIRYPEALDHERVAMGDSFPADWLTPKESWMLGELHSRLEDGENVILFLRHTGTAALPQRLLRLIRDNVTSKVEFLSAQKVPTSKRQGWIDRHVNQAGARVLLVNPNAVRTGLNNLTRFSTAIWYQLDWSATTVRQANGRLHRLGQKRSVTILVPYYAETTQQIGVQLVARKISASLQVDGLDLQGSLEAAGAGEDEREAGLSALSIGAAVYDLLTHDSGLYAA